MNLQYQNVMQFLAKHAPNMDMKSADELARTCDVLRQEADCDANNLAILSLTVCSDMITKDRKVFRPAVQQAIDSLSYRQAWVQCGPVTDSKNKFLKEEDEKAYRTGKYNYPEKESAC